MSFSLMKSQGKIRLLSDQVLAPVPKRLLQALAELACHTPPLFFSGGVVRDWLLNRVPVDLDITLAQGALAFAEKLAARLGAAYVPLSPGEGVARVVWREFSLDISEFREGTTTLEDDLCRRDFSVNAMAVGFDHQRLSLADSGRIIDPAGGLVDLAQGVIRLAYPEALVADPLRMLRAYRFRALYGWSIAPKTQAAIAGQVSLIRGVSGERIAAELDKILSSSESYGPINEMVEAGLLLQLFPELGGGVGLLQPSSHHLDVFGHSLETLRQMERIIDNPGALFTRAADLTPGGSDGSMPSTPAFDWSQEFAHYLNAPGQAKRLKYAALFHDLGKTTTYAVKEGRITFHNHDEAGVALFKAIAQRLRFSCDDTQRISQLVRQHMWPFHLQNARRKTGITPRAILRLVKAAGEDLMGLFMLVMADSLAGQGSGKPEGMEEAVATLFSEVYQTYLGRLKPLMAQPLLTGRDLIEILQLTPGPQFKKILDGLLEARATLPEMTREEALLWAKEFAERV